MLGNAHVLPDSRLKDQNQAALMVDWQLTDGRTVRLEVVPVYCANCGVKYGHVPRDTTAFACWLCRRCHETHGDIAGTYAVPDEDFNQAVQAEMEARFGRALTEAEIIDAIRDHRLGPALEALARESPYPVRSEGY